MKKKSSLHILLYGDCFDNKFFQSLSYLSLFENYGQVTLVTPYTLRDEHLNADVLVIPGGADVDPKRYGEKPGYFTGRANTQYEYMDTIFLPEWIKTQKPIIGICRGMQSLNVAFGGSLHQDIYGHMGDPKDRKEEWHKIYTDFYVNPIEDFRVYGVNSFHHQSVKELAPDFDILGWSVATKYCPSYGRGIENPLTMVKKFFIKEGEIKKHEKLKEYYAIVEIIKHRTLPYIGFQYHPEDMNCPLFHLLVSNMLEGKDFKDITYGFKKE